MGSLAARFIFRPIEDSGYFYFTQMVKRDKTISDQNPVSIHCTFRTIKFYIYIYKPKFSGESARERECVDTYVFRRYIYRSDCPSIRSVLLEHVALVVRWFEVDFTSTCSFAKGALSRRVIVGNQRRD